MYDLVGHNWGGYSIQADLGWDDLGVVYQAKEQASGRVVRLWILAASLTQQSNALRRRLEQAVEKAKGFAHPNVAAVYGLSDVEGHFCITSEYEPGITLRELLSRKGALSPRQAAGIVRDLAGAVEALVQAGLTDIDLQPGQVVITPDGHAVLMDTGLTHFVRAMAVPTRGQPIFRAAAYMAPEVSRGAQPDERSVVYSLGIILFEMLAGRPPFQGTDAEVVLAHQNQAAPSLRQAGKHTTAAMEVALGKALSREPEARYGRPMDMVADLRIGGRVGRLFSLPRLPEWAGPAAAVVAVIVLGGWIAAKLYGGSRTIRISLAGQPPFTGVYEVVVPQRIRADETFTIRLRVRAEGALAVENLPEVPAPTPGSVESDAMVGLVPLCKQLWATLESPALAISGPSTLRRTIDESGAEWIWTVERNPGLTVSGAQPAVIRLSTRPNPSDSSEVVLKDIHFQVQTTARAGWRAGVDLELALIGAITLSAIVLLLVSRRRKAA